MPQEQPAQDTASWRPSRRKLLGAAGLGAVGLTIGVASPAAAHGTLVSYNEIGGYPTYYHNLSTNARSASPVTFSYNPTFYSRLETWASFWYLNTPGSWGTPIHLWLNGTHVDKGGMHEQARAMDISRIMFTSAATFALTVGFDGRYDLWRTRTGTALTAVRKQYWATIASFNYHFRHVLHYFESGHQNHTHVDNAISGSGNSNFSTSSTTQLRYVQASLNYIWGYSTTIDGIWGSQTDGNSRKALTRIGRSGGLTTSQTNWLEYNKATFRFGNGAQFY